MHTENILGLNAKKNNISKSTSSITHKYINVNVSAITIYPRLFGTRLIGTRPIGTRLIGTLKIDRVSLERVSLARNPSHILIPHSQSRIIRCKNLALYIRDCVSLCLSNETLKAVGPFYLVSMPGEVKYPTQGVNV